MFSKNLYFLKKNRDFVENSLEKKFFSRDFDIFLWQDWMRNKVSCGRDFFFCLFLYDKKLKRCQSCQS